MVLNAKILAQTEDSTFAVGQYSLTIIQTMHKIIFVPLNTPKHLCISQDLAEVNVEHVARFLHHDVVIVAITYAEHICSNAVPSARACEIIHCLKNINTGSIQQLLNSTHTQNVLTRAKGTK